MPDKLTASEALFGFAGWITTRGQPVTASAYHEAGVWSELITQFCEANGLEKPREDWAEHLVHPPTLPPQVASA